MISRNFKDTLFCDLFGNEERKGNALELYNALNGTAYSEADEIELNTLEDVIYMGIKNDVSFIFRNEMVLWEHQSTVNRNMPLRCLLYLGELYSRKCVPDRKALYRERRIEIPSPRFVVLYNGEKEQPEESVQRLSDSFRGGLGDAELEVRILNVNEGCNEAVMRASKTLSGYAHLVALARAYNRDEPLDVAVRKAVEQCREEEVLVDYLESTNTGSAAWRLLTEFDEEAAHEAWREDGYDEGYETGMEKGLEAMASRLRELGVDEEKIGEALAQARS